MSRKAWTVVEESHRYEMMSASSCSRRSWIGVRENPDRIPAGPGSDPGPEHASDLRLHAGGGDPLVSVQLDGLGGAFTLKTTLSQDGVKHLEFRGRK